LTRLERLGPSNISTSLKMSNTHRHRGINNRQWLLTITKLTFSPSIRSRERGIFANDVFIDIFYKFHGISRLLWRFWDFDVIIGKSVELSVGESLRGVFHRIHYWQRIIFQRGNFMTHTQHVHSVRRTFRSDAYT